MDASPADRSLYRALNRLLAKMMAPLDTGAWIDTAVWCRENVLPAPLPGCCRIFPFECEGEKDSAKSISQIFLVSILNAFQMTLEWSVVKGDVTIFTITCQNVIIKMDFSAGSLGSG